MGDSAVLESLRLAMWTFLDRKHGTSTAIADAEDRAARAAIGGMFGTGTPDAAFEAARWADNWLGGPCWDPAGYVREVMSIPDAQLCRLLSETFMLLGEAALPGLLGVLRDPTTPPPAKVEAALSAVWLGDTGEAADTLIELVETSHQSAVAAANQLARRRVARAAPAVARAFEKVDVTDSVAITNLSDALRELSGSPTRVALARIGRDSPDWVARVILGDWANIQLGGSGPCGGTGRVQ